MGCTIGIATCAKLRQEGADLDLSLDGVNTLVELAQMHLVSKLMVSCDITFLLCTPPSMGMKRKRGMRVALGNALA